MDQTPHTTPDGLDKLLQKYLLEKNPLGPDGKPLMEAARRTALGATPVVTPSAAKEAEMLRRLQTRVADLPKPGPTGISAGLRWGLLTFTTAAVVTTTAALLWLQPFRNTEVADSNVVSKLAENNPHSIAQSGTQSAVSPWVSTAPLASEEVKERSLQRSNQEQGSGSPDLNPGRGHSRSGTRSANSTNALQRSEEGLVTNDPVSLVATPTLVETPAPVQDLFPLRNIFNELLPEVTGEKAFANQNGFLMETQRGTLLHFPAGAFVTLSGLPVRGQVDVKVREAYDRSDFLRANLAGLPGENAFVNGGAIEITATAGGEVVTLAPGRDIYVVFARNGTPTTETLRTYNGTRNPAGRMAWASSGDVASKMVPIAVEDMHFAQFWCSETRDVHWREIITSLDDPRNPFVNSWVYTVEFRDRLRAAYDMGHASPVVKMYLDNTDKELWIVDQMVAQAIKKNPTAMGNPLVHDHDGHNSSVDADAFFRFADQRKSTLMPYRIPQGVNIDTADAQTQLERTGMSSADAAKLLRTHALRQMFTRRIQTAAVAVMPSKASKEPKYRDVSNMPDLSLSNAYHLRQLGWNLRSEALVVPVMRSVSLDVTAPGMAPGSRAWVVMEKGNVIAEGQPTANGFVFNGLPIGQSAQVVVIGSSEAGPLAGISRISTGKSPAVTVHVSQMSLVKLDRELDALDQ